MNEQSRNQWHEHWKLVEDRLKVARSMLDLPSESFTQFEECLEHNEFERALDELEGLASGQPGSGRIWGHLLTAAKMMKLPDHTARIESRIDS